MWIGPARQIDLLTVHKSSLDKHFFPSAEQTKMHEVAAESRHLPAK
jgi:hypothetical protein